MASLVSQPRHSIQTYWARRSYQRLCSPSRRLRVARLGARATPQQPAAPPRRSPWAARAARLRGAVLAAPALLLARFRDAYVDAMLALGGCAVRPCATLARSRSGAEAGLWVPRARQQMQLRRGGGAGDFERRMMAHIYPLHFTSIMFSMNYPDVASSGIRRTETVLRLVSKLAALVRFSNIHTEIHEH